MTDTLPSWVTESRWSPKSVDPVSFVIRAEATFTLAEHLHVGNGETDTLTDEVLLTDSLTGRPFFPVPVWRAS